LALLDVWLFISLGWGGKRRPYLPFRMTRPPDWFHHWTRLKNTWHEVKVTGRVLCRSLGRRGVLAVVNERSARDSVPH
jgi:hypothetical protein